MKKEKFLNFLESKWLVVAFVALGFMLSSSSTVVAQSPIDDVVATVTNLRNEQVPGTAKFDFAQAALDYLEVLEENLATNPNYLNDLEDQTGIDPLFVPVMRRAHRTILADYSASELATFQSLVNDAGQFANQKIQFIVEANEY